MKFIGITGGIGAGKSEVLKYIENHYLCKIYLADQVAHEVKLPGTACYAALVELLGQDCLMEDGTIHKGKMAQRIFEDQTLLEQVNALIHPAVLEYICQRLEETKKAADAELFFVEAALLIECGYKERVDEMWYVYADQETRARRLMESRGYSLEKIHSIMQQQLDDEAFRQAADFVIDNSSTLESMEQQIRTKLKAYTWLA